ncbi:MAG: hypothetical protein HYV60_18235 [Planctomycetia bacterium]|nr:hypothetical protein [Planctomycetia bacterium]
MSILNVISDGLFRKAEHFRGESPKHPGVKLQLLAGSRLAMLEVPARARILPAKQRPTNVATDAVTRSKILTAASSMTSL